MSGASVTPRAVSILLGVEATFISICSKEGLVDHIILPSQGPRLGFRLGEEGTEISSFISFGVSQILSPTMSVEFLCSPRKSAGKVWKKDCLGASRLTVGNLGVTHQPFPRVSSFKRIPSVSSERPFIPGLSSSPRY